MFCQVCLVKCLFAKASWKRTCFAKYAWWNAVLQDKLKENMLCQTLSSMPGEMPFCKTKLKENMFCHVCQVCLVKCRFAKTSWKKTCFVVCLVKCRFAKTSWKRTCFVKYAFVKLWQVCRFAKRNWKRTCFVKSAWWNIEREHALSSMPGEISFRWKREHALSSMPGEMTFSKNKLKENMLCRLCQVCLVKCRFAKTSWKRTYLTKHVLFLYFTRQTWQSMFSFSFFLQNGILVKVWQRHTWQSTFSFSLFLQNGISPGIRQSMFSFSLFLQNGISPGILDKHDKTCSLSAWFCKTAFHQAYLTKFDKACSLSACLAKRHFTRHTWQSMFSFSLLLQKDTSPGILDKTWQNMTKHDKTWQNMFSFGMILQTGIPSIRYTWQSMSSFSLFLQNGTSPGILDKDDKACSLSACFWKTSFHQAYLTTHVLFFSETIFHQAYLTKHERVWEGSGKAKNAAWKGGWVLHGSQEWGGKGLGRLKMVPKSVVGAPSHPTLRNHEKHPNPFSCFIFSLPNPSHPTLAPKPLFHASFLVFPPTPLLGTMKHEAWSMKRGLGASWFPRVGWEGLGKAQNEAWKKVWVLHGSQAWGGKGLGRPRIKHEKGVGCFMAHKSGVGRAWEGSKWFPRVLWEWFGKAKNEAWKGVWVLHGSQEWGGKGLGTLGMKHEKGFGCFSWLARVGWEGFGKAKNEAWKRRWVFLMIPKGGVGRAWEGSKWFPRVLWEWFGKAKNDAWKRGCVLHGSQEWVGRAWER